MKKLLFIITVFSVFACNEGAEKKPEKLLSEEQMTDIFYDLSLLQAIKSYTPRSLDEANVDAKNYVYKKYAIDSTVFAQNHRYYASKLDVYKKIQDRVADRLKNEKAKLEPQKGTEKKEELSKAEKDSLKAMKTVLKTLEKK